MSQLGDLMLYYAPMKLAFRRSDFASSMSTYGPAIIRQIEANKVPSKGQLVQMARVGSGDSTQAAFDNLRQLFTAKLVTENAANKTDRTNISHL